MAVNQGLKTLAESTPNFSNQAIQNSINDVKIGWAAKSIDLDTAIQSNTVLTTSQKTDLKQTINNVAYLNVGRYMGDILRHVNTILDGTIIPIPEEELVDNPVYATFLEILQQVQSVQGLVPEFYGQSASEKGKGVNDYLGILNGKLSDPLNGASSTFETLKDSIQYITNANLATDTAYQSAIDDLKNFIDSVEADSTDFQQTLDTFATAVATAATNFDTALQASPYNAKRTQMIADRDAVNTQVNLENANLTTIRDYVDSLSSNTAYIALAGDTDLRNLMIRTSQNATWRTYFENFGAAKLNDNPIYNNPQSDSSNAGIIDTVLRLRGLPDVTDYVDIDSVAAKSLRDTRLTGKLSDSGKTTEQIITDACVLLSIAIDNKDIYAKSKSLLANMNENDREIVKRELDLHKQVNTLS